MRLSLRQLQRHLSELDAARKGCTLRCTWPGGVRFRDERGEKTKLRLAPGDECRVLERHGSWVRSLPGWLPLWADAEADHQPLFEVGASGSERSYPLVPGVSSCGAGAGLFGKGFKMGQERPREPLILPPPWSLRSS